MHAEGSVAVDVVVGGADGAAAGNGAVDARVGKRDLLVLVQAVLYIAVPRGDVGVGLAVRGECDGRLTVLNGRERDAGLVGAEAQRVDAALILGVADRQAERVGERVDGKALIGALFAALGTPVDLGALALNRVLIRGRGLALELIRAVRGQVRARELDMEGELMVGVARLALYLLGDAQAAVLQRVLKDRLLVHGLVERERAVAVVLDRHGVDEGALVVLDGIVGSRDLAHAVVVGLAGVVLVVLDAHEGHGAVGVVGRELAHLLAGLGVGRREPLELEVELVGLEVAALEGLPRGEAELAGGFVLVVEHDLGGAYRRLGAVLAHLGIAHLGRKRPVAVVGNHDVGNKHLIAVGVAALTLVLLNDDVAVSADVGEAVADGAELHVAVGVVARGGHHGAVCGVAVNGEEEEAPLNGAARELLAHAQASLAGRAVGVREHGLGHVGRAGADNAPVALDRRLRVTRRRGLGHLIGRLGRDVLDRGRLAALEGEAPAVGDGARAPVGGLVLVAAAVRLAVGAGQREGEGEVSLRARVGRVHDLLLDGEVAVGAVRVHDVRTVQRGDVALVVHILAYLVGDLLTLVAVLGQAGEAIGPVAGVVGLDRLGPGEHAVGVEAHLDARGTLARGVVSVIPGLGSLDGHGLGLVLVGELEDVARVALLEHHVGRVAVDGVLDQRVGDLVAVGVEHREAVVAAELGRPAVLLGKNGALARVHAVCVDVDGHAVGAHAVAVVRVVPCLGHRDSEGLEANLDVVLTDVLVLGLGAHLAHGREAQGRVVVLVGAAREARLGLAVGEVGVEPLAVLGGVGLQVLDLRRAHLEREGDGAAGLELEVGAADLLTGVHRDGGHVVEAARVGCGGRPVPRVGYVDLRARAVVKPELVHRRGAVVDHGRDVGKLEGGGVHPEQATPPLGVTRVGLIADNAVGGRVEGADGVEEDHVLGGGLVGVGHRDPVTVGAVLVDVLGTVDVQAATPVALVVDVDLLVQARDGPRHVVDGRGALGIDKGGVVVRWVEVGHDALDALDGVGGGVVIARGGVVRLALEALDGAPALAARLVGDVVGDLHAVVDLGVVGVRGVELDGDLVAVAVVALARAVVLVAVPRVGHDARFDGHERAAAALVVAGEGHALHGVVAVELDGRGVRLDALGKKVVERARGVLLEGARLLGRVVELERGEVRLLVDARRVVDVALAVGLVVLDCGGLLHGDARGGAGKGVVGGLAGRGDDSVAAAVVGVELRPVAQDGARGVGVLKEILDARPDGVGRLNRHLGIHGVDDARGLGGDGGLEVRDVGREDEQVAADAGAVLGVRGDGQLAGRIADGAELDPVLAVLGARRDGAVHDGVGDGARVGRPRVAVAAAVDVAPLDDALGVLAVTVAALLVLLVLVNLRLRDVDALELEVDRGEVRGLVVELRLEVVGVDRHGDLAVVALEEVAVVGVLTRGPGAGEGDGLDTVAAGHGLAVA